MIVDNYFKDGFLFLKARYVGETLVEDNITEVRFEDLNKDVSVDLGRYIRNHVVEASRRTGTSSAWAVNILKGYTRDISCLYRVTEIGRGYRLEMDGMSRKQALEAKLKIPRVLRANMSRNESKKVKKDREKFGYKITNNSREALFLDKKMGTRFGLLPFPRRW